MEKNDPCLNDELKAAEQQNPTTATPETPQSESKTDAIETENIAPDTEEVTIEVIATEPEDTNEESTPTDQQGVLDQARAVLEKDAADISRDEVSRLRHLYMSLAPKQEEAEQPAEAEAATPQENPLDAEFNAVIAAIREKKAAHTAEQEAIKQNNLAGKNSIIEQIIALADDTDNINRTFAQYRELQERFSAIGDVPPTEETGVWKRYQEARERYSDSLKINKELRDYDFKKNLDAKNLLIEMAEKLADESDIIVAFKQLQNLHLKWREVGPVAKEMRQEIWDKFKDASAVINKRYQAFFEERKAREAANEQGKTELCERVEALDFSNLKSYPAWEEMTKQIIQAQEDWKKLGFASRKMNNALFARFRATCDNFFTAKAAYYKAVKEELANNLARKQALVERANALKDSTDWRNATEQFVEIQKEWKTIGTVAKKHSDNIWRQFQEACDYFFEQKKQATHDVRSAERDNLKTKRAIIAALDDITADTPRDEAIKTLRDLQAKWNETGHVPFRDKDKVNDAYRAKVNELRKMLDLSGQRSAMDRFESSLAEIEGDENKMYRERERYVRILDAKRQELRTYTNNLGFLTSKSKSGQTLLREAERKIELLKADIAQIEEKIKILTDKL